MYDFTVGAEIRAAGRLYAIGGYRWLKFNLVNEPNDKVSNELFAGVRWQLDWKGCCQNRTGRPRH